MEFVKKFWMKFFNELNNFLLYTSYTKGLETISNNLVLEFFPPGGIRKNFIFYLYSSFCSTNYFYYSHRLCMLQKNISILTCIINWSGYRILFRVMLNLKYKRFFKKIHKNISVLMFEGYTVIYTAKYW